MLIATVLQMFYTFFFGFCMYLALRVTGTIIAPILLHSSTDPSIFMQGTYPAEGSLSSIAQLGNIILIVFGVVLVVVFIISETRAGHRNESWLIDSTPLSDR